MIKGVIFVEIIIGAFYLKPYIPMDIFCFLFKALYPFGYIVVKYELSFVYYFLLTPGLWAVTL